MSHPDPRTYIPGLRLVLNAFYRYGTRWQPKLQVSLTAPQYECFIDVLTAVTTCLSLLGPPDIEQ